MNPICRAILLITHIGLLAGCSHDDNLNAPKEFFANHKVGGSPDIGLFKWGGDHVATIHSFMDDLAVCEQFANMLNNDACKDTGGVDCRNPFSCQQLNL